MKPSTIIKISASALVLLAVAVFVVSSPKIEERADAWTEAVSSETEETVCAHSFEKTGEVSPTCTEAGYEIYTCTLCGETEKKEIAATGHVFGDTEIIRPTCTTDGCSVHTCSVCGHAVYDTEIDALGHNYVAVSKTSATCEKAGYTTYECTVCGSTYEKETEAQLEHSFTANIYGEKRVNGGDVEFTCSECGEKKTFNITVPDGCTLGITVKVTKTPTCQEKGEYSAGGSSTSSGSLKTITGEIATVDHEYCDRTCLRPWLCKWCYDNIGSPLGHIYDEGTFIWQNALGEGVKRYHCTVCGEYTDVKICYSYPKELTDTPIMRALQYLGYDVQGMIDDGVLFSVYGDSPLAAKYRSGIRYTATQKAGIEGNNTIEDKTTVTGLAPNIDLFEKRGLICASFTTYYLFNYLPNIEGTTAKKLENIFYNKTLGGYNMKAVKTWKLALGSGTVYGLVDRIWRSDQKDSYTEDGEMNLDMSTLQAGDFIIFMDKNRDANHHIAVYIGEWDGEYFVAHCTYPQGVEITTLSEIYDPYGTGDKNGYLIQDIYRVKLNESK